jgi:hypothetical protein
MMMRFAVLTVSYVLELRYMMWRENKKTKRYGEAGGR